MPAERQVSRKPIPRANSVRRVPTRTTAGPSLPTQLQRRLGNSGTQAFLQTIAAKPAPSPSGTAIQPKLMVGSPDDMYEREADAVAERVVAGRPVERISRLSPAGLAQSLQRQAEPEEDPVQSQEAGEEKDLQMTVLQRQQMDEEEPVQMEREALPVHRMCENCLQEARRQGMQEPIRTRASDEEQPTHLLGATSAVQTMCENCRGQAQRQKKAEEAEEEAVQTKLLTRTARQNSPLAAKPTAFAAGEFSPGTAPGRHLLAHELTHVTQQRSSSAALIQRQETPRRTPARPAPALDFRPAINTPPCACLVFVHNTERNARRAVQALHRVCRYNLAIVGNEAARGRNIRVPGAGAKDPNELFPSQIRTDCEADLDACRTEAAGRDNLRATQMSYYLAIRDCTNNFALPLVALHNNLINDTARMRRHRIDPATNSSLSRRYAAKPTGDQLSIDELRQRLRDLGMSRGAMRGLLTRSRTTNIYRWCNLPEIGRCAVGDPARPDHVIWVVRDDDFERLANGGFNVVQQTSAAEGSESDTDLSTMLLGIDDARYINIETPQTARNRLDDEPQRAENMKTILLALRAAGLECCDVDSSPDEDTEGPVLQRQEIEEEEPLQGEFTTSGVPAQLQGDGRAAGNSTGMPDPLKVGLESLSGVDLSGVRVHRNSAKPAQLNALAYTQGQDIHVGPGQEKHLPHEGWHAVQQMQGRVQPTMQAKGVSINDDEELEQEANVMGARAARQMQSSGNVGLHATNIATLTGPAQLLESSEQPVLDEYRGRNINKVGFVSAPADQYRIAITSGVNIRAKPDGTLPHIAKVLYGTEAQVQALDNTDAFYFIIAKTGEVGWINKNYVALDPPDAGSRLHHITESNLTTILKNEYVDKKLWILSTGNDYTTLAAAVVVANEGRIGVSVDWKKVEKYKEDNTAKKWLDPWMIDNFAIYHGSTILSGHNIWLPSPSYVRILQRSGTIGSRPDWVNAAVDIGKGIAGFLAGIVSGVLGSLWDTLTGLWELGKSIVNTIKSVLDGSIFASIEAIYDTVTGVTWQKFKTMVDEIITMGKSALTNFAKNWEHPDTYKRWHFRGSVIGAIVLEIVLAIYTGGGTLAAKILAKVGKYLPKLMRIFDKLLDLADRLPGRRRRARDDGRDQDRDRDDKEMNKDDRAWEQARALAAIVTEGHDSKDPSIPIEQLIPILNRTIAIKFKGVSRYDAIPKSKPNTYKIIQRTGKKRDDTVDRTYTEGVESESKEPYRGTRGEEIDPTVVDVFRGGTDLKVDRRHIKLDEDNLVKTSHGLSLDTDAARLEPFGGGHRVKSIPPELRIIQRGKRRTHFEIVPREKMPLERFEALVGGIELD